LRTGFFQPAEGGEKGEMGDRGQVGPGRTGDMARMLGVSAPSRSKMDWSIVLVISP